MSTLRTARIQEMGSHSVWNPTPMEGNRPHHHPSLVYLFTSWLDRCVPTTHLDSDCEVLIYEEQRIVQILNRTQKTTWYVQETFSALFSNGMSGYLFSGLRFRGVYRIQCLVYVHGYVLGFLSRSLFIDMDCPHTTPVQYLLIVYGESPYCL